MSILVGLFGVVWTVVAASAGGGVFALFGIFFIAVAVVQAIYNFKNATGKNRYSAFDITDSSEEPDPLNERFGNPQITTQQRNDVDNKFCPYCGTPVAGDTDSGVPVGYTPEEVAEPIDRSGDNMRIGAYLWNGFISVAGMTNHHMEEFYEYREPLWGYRNPNIEEMEFQIEMATITVLISLRSTTILPSILHTTIQRLKILKMPEFPICLISGYWLSTLMRQQPPSQDTWQIAMDNYIYYMTRDNALKIDGKPVIIFITPYNLIKFMGGTEKTKAALDQMEQAMIDRGYPGIVILGCDSPYGDAYGNIDYNEANFNATVFKKRIVQ